MFAETLGIDALTCVELRSELESRGLDKGGRKAELVERLEESLHLELETGAAWWSASEDDDDAQDELDERDDDNRRDDDDDDAAPGAGIRVLTLNVCVIPSGMRNYNIPSLGLYGGFLVGALALAALVGAWWRAACHLFPDAGVVPRVFAHIVGVSHAFWGPFLGGAVCVLLPVAVVIAQLFGAQGGRLIGGIILPLFGGGHDFKRERLEALVRDTSILDDYDCVCLQVRREAKRERVSE